MERGARMLSDTGIEENTLAILDPTGIKDAKDDVDDRLAFLEAVRAASLAPDAGVAPTSKMCQAIFRILREGKNLELCMATYQLLMDINKRFPRVIAPNVDTTDSSSTPVDSELVVVNEAWSPFASGSDIPARTRGASGENDSRLIDSCNFHQLIERLVEEADKSNIALKHFADMLLFDYLVDVLDGDFLPRWDSYKETANWALVRDSLLNKLLSSRRINYKGFIKDCVTLISTLQSLSTGDSRGDEDSEVTKPSRDCDAAVSLAFLEREKCTCLAVRKLLLMIMELDALKKSADTRLQTTRGDSVRTPAMEIILDELMYNTDALFHFLQVFDEPNWKLELAVQYLRKYIAKPSVRTRRSQESADDGTLVGLLKTLSNHATAKTVIRKIRSREVLGLLLAHAFQAYLSLSLGEKKQYAQGSDTSLELLGGSSREEVCKGVISAFQSLKKADERAGALPIGKQALFTAAAILSIK
uniref:Negative regulator of systemic acquired resistance SNI1 n=1 Tax=Kalanchoe fedtschenkoi TaxID=63787 RepID=A0A7N0UG95_KALFE